MQVLKAFLLAVVLTLFAVGAQAANPYVGGGVGQGHASGFDTFDDMHTSGKVYTGICPLNVDKIKVCGQVDYDYLGKFSGLKTVQGSAYSANVIGVLPIIPKLSALVGIGSAWWSTDSHEDVTTLQRATLNHSSPSPSLIPSTVTVHGHSYGNGLTYRLGLQLDLKPVAFRIEGQRFQNIGTDVTGSGNVDVLTASALLQF